MVFHWQANDGPIKAVFGSSIPLSTKKKHYGKCSKISNTLKLRTPKIIAENNF